MDARWSRRMKVVGGTPLLTLTGVVLGAFSMAPAPALAACTTTGVSVICNTPALALSPNLLNNTNGLTVTVGSGGTIAAGALPLLSPAVSLGGTNVTLNNQGTISSNLLGLISVGTTAVRMGSTTASGTVNVQNSGTVTGTGLVSVALLGALDGAALDLRSGSGGTITIDNAASGVIGSAALLNIGVLSDSPTIAAYGGARVNASNAGTITGRVGLGTSAGNTFINRGAITGSVHMGVNSANTFTNVVGSSVSAGSGIGVSILGPTGTGLSFAAAGVVDGGAGGTNTLVLRNAVDGDVGASGAGTVNAANYINFQNLALNSGTWTLLGGPIASTNTTLNGGVAIFNTSDTFGTGLLTANGGTIQAGVSGLNLANTVALNGVGLTTNAGNSFTMSGAVGGTGSLTKSGTHTLTLTGNNTYTGGTVLSGGSLVAGSATALGAGPLNVTGNAFLSSSAGTTLGNAVNLGATLTLPGTQALGLSGPISGVGNLVKNGAAGLTLSGSNTFSGGTTLNAGTLTLGNNTALGNGALTVGGASSLATTGGPLTVANNITLNNALTTQVVDDLTLTGNLSGGGRLVKQGTGVLTLAGNSTYTGGTTLSAGELRVGSNTALGSGQLIAADGVRLSSGTAVTLNNAALLNGALTVAGAQSLALVGALTGTAGAIVKTGTGTLTLAGNNTFGATAAGGAGVTLNSGTLAVGSNAALGAGSLQVGGASTLTATTNVALNNVVGLGADLTVAGANTLALGGAIGGAGKVIKQDAGNLVLNAANTFTGGTQLLGGALTVGTAGALGAGWLVVDGAATLGAGASTSVANGIRLNAGLDVATNGNAFTLSGPILGAGGLRLADGGTLTLSGTNTFNGGTTLSAGRLVLGDASALSAGPLTVAGAARLDTLVATTLNNAVALNSTLTLDGTQDLTLAGTIAGAGDLVKNGVGNLTLAGVNAYGNTTINAGTVNTGAANLGASVVNNGTLVFTQNQTGTYAGSISGNGAVTLDGASTLTLSGNNTFTGGMNIVRGTLETVGGNALADSVAVSVGADARLRLTDSEVFGSLTGPGAVELAAQATATLGANNYDSIFSGNLQGSGTVVKTGIGTLTLSGTNDHTGGITVDGGRLTVDGTLASANVGVNAGAALSGIGSLAGVVNLANDAVLELRTGQTLGMGSLSLAENAKVNAYLGAPSTTALANVAGNVTLDGDLNVYDVGDFGVGVYRLFQYGGTLVDNGLSIGVVPDTVLPGQIVVQTSIDSQVNLVVQGTNPDGLQFWNGPQLVANGSIVGGSGTWQAGRTNWTNQAGTQTQTWQDVNGVFAGPAGGTVAVVGTQNINGLQFFTDGYTLAGTGALSLAAPNTIIRVDPTNTATINAALAGAGGLNKRDTGTLILGGNNTYAGGTTLSEGVLQVAADNRLGQAGGALNFNGGTLRIAGTSFGSTARNITWGGVGGGFDVASAANTFTAAQDLTGVGRLTKTGAGTLVLAGANNLASGVNLAAGTLRAGQAGSLGTGVLDVTGNATLGATGNLGLSNALAIAGSNTLTVAGDTDLTLGGIISGPSGVLQKNGAQTLTLTGANTYGGGTLLNAGTLNVGNDLALGTGALTVAGASTLAATDARALANAIALNGDLTVDGINALALNGTISGPARLIKSGSGNLLLTTANTHGGTVLNAGSLTLGNAGALGVSALAVDGDARLDATQALTVANAIVLGGELTAASVNDLTVSGGISGAGSLALVNPQRTLTLTGDNTYSGGTRLAGGTLVAGSDTALGTGALNVQAAATLASAAGPRSLGNAVVLGDTLTLTANDDMTLSGIVSGDGALVKNGADGATLTLAGANTYTGGTTINGGAVVLGVNSAAGTASSLGTGTLTINGNVVLSSQQATLALDNAIATNGVLTVGSGQASTLNGAISGGGSLALAGGDVTLNGDNAYLGGTSLSGGRLTVGGATALGTGALAVRNAGTLASTGTVALANDIRMDNGLTVDALAGQEITLSGDISGGAGLTKAGDGTLILQGANSYGTGTTLAAGTLRISDGLSLGSGALAVTGAATLGATQALTLNNDINLTAGAALTFDAGPTMTLTSIIEGAGGVVKNAGETVLTAANTYTGGTTLNGGILRVGGTSALGATESSVTVNGGTLATLGEAALSNDVNLAGDLIVSTADTLTMSGVVGGAGGLVKQNSGTLRLTGANTFAGDIAIEGGTVVGSTTSLLNNVSTAAGTRIVFDQAVDDAYGGVLSGSGDFDKQGAGTLTLAGANTLTGEIGVSAGALTVNNGQTLANARNVRIDTNAALNLTDSASIASLTGSGQLNLLGGGTTLTYARNDDGIFAGTLGGDGTFAKIGTGTLTLTGGGAHTGLIAVNQGGVQLDGAFGSTVAVANGATLSGNGSVVGAASIADGGILSLDAGRGPFTAGTLTLSNGSIINAQFGGAGAGALADVTGNLTLDGTVNVSDTSGLGVGSYRLFNYGGALTDNVLALGSLPGNIIRGNVVIQTAIAGQVNIVNQDVSGQLQFWDPRESPGPDEPVPDPDGQITGGSGVWDSAVANFTNITGTSADNWGNMYAVFARPAGPGTPATPATVTIVGAQDVAGLHFSGDGYVLNAGADGAINAIGDPDGLLAIRVDNGLTTTINAPIRGDATLAKRDDGTLLLGGVNTYTGGTRIDAGILQVSQDANLGAAAGAITLGNGTLRVADNVASSRNIVLAGNGTIDVVADPDIAPEIVLDYSGQISGGGSLTKTGGGVLALVGGNTYTGGTALRGGTLAISGEQALGSGAVSVSGGGILYANDEGSLTNDIDIVDSMAVTVVPNLGGSSDLTLSGIISGANGNLVKSGTDTLTLTGANTYNNGTGLIEGSLAVGSDSALGTGKLDILGGTTLVSLGDRTLANNISLAPAPLLPDVGSVFDTRDSTLTLTGAITGDGRLDKIGVGTLVLTGTNGYQGGTEVTAGTLLVGGNSALGTGAVVLADGTRLGSLNAVGLNNAVTLEGNASLGSDQDMTLAGVVSGPGNLSKVGNGTLTLTNANTYGGGTALNAGTLVVGNDLALGTGGLTTAAGTTLDSLAGAGAVPIVLANAVTIGGGLTVAGTNDLSLTGNVSGGSLTKAGPATLTLNGDNSALTGGIGLNAGTLVAGTNAALGTGTLTVGGPATLTSANVGGTPLVLGNAIVLNDALTVATTTEPLTLAGNITGDAGLTKTGNDTLTLTGTNAYGGGTSVQAGTLAGDAGSLQGTIATASGAQVAFNQTNPATGIFTGSVNGGGAVALNGGTLTMTGPNSYTGGTTINAGTLIGNTTSLTGNIVDNGTLIFDQATDGTFAGAISGTGSLVKRNAGDLQLTGTTNIGGTANIEQGGLVVDGVLTASQIDVAQGASLGGSGALNANVNMADFSTLVAGTPLSPLNINGSLALSNQTQIDLGLGIPNTPTNAITVNGDLTLDGVLNVSDAGGMGTGVYRLFAFSGGLTDNGLVYGNLPGSFTQDNLTLQTQSNAVNLLVELTPGEIQFWNGDKTQADGTITGGAGTWGAGTNWTDSTGTQSQSWGSRFAVFDGTGATVTVAGPQTVTGLQFLADGYQLTAGAAGAISIATADTVFRVANGARATIDAPITGAGGISLQQDTGTLVLNGTNTYTGGTAVRAGTLVVSADANLGNAAAGLSLANGGILSIAGSNYTGTARGVTLANSGGAIAIQNAAHTFDLSGRVTGDGAFTKTGAGTLVLSGVNDYTGGTIVAAGTLVGNTQSLQGNIANNGALVFDQSAAGIYAGALSGAGTLTKQGGGSLTLTGSNTVGGATAVNGGVLRVDGSLTTASVTVNDSATLAGAGTVAGNVTVANGGRLAADTVTNRLNIDGTLALNQTSQLDIGLGAPNTGNTAITVAGDLTLDGILNVSDVGGMSTGVYQLLSYGGALTDNGVDFGALPAGYTSDNFNLQTNLGQSVNLVVESTVGDIRFWNGAKTTADGTIGGGTGTWSAGATNWTNATGTETQSWNDRFAVFGAAGGTVTVEGTQNLTGLQFLSDGYQLAAGAAGELAISAPNTVFRVADGARAILNLPITGAGGLTMLQDRGTLVLNGTNTYGGGTTVNAGTLEVSNDANLGAAATGITLAGGALRIAGTDYDSTARVITLAEAGGTIELADAGHTLTLAGANSLTGAGGLIKSGPGTLALTADNNFAGGTTLNAGGLAVGSNTALGSGQLTVSGPSRLTALNAVTLGNAIVLSDTLSLTGAQDVGLAGNITGAGGLIKQDGGTLTLTGTNAYTGGTQVLNGSLVGNSAALQGDILNNGTVTFDQTTAGSYGGALTGTGALDKLGGGSLALTGTSTLSGATTIQAGTLWVEGNLTTASTSVAPGATLGGSGTVGGSVAVADGGRLTSGAGANALSVTGNLTLANTSQLDYSLGAPGSASTAITVAGDLTLDGVLNVADAGGFGTGVYHLFDYDGALANNTIDIGSLPAGYGPGLLAVQTLLPGAVNLVVESTPGEIQFWNGAKTVADNTLEGGDGSWTAAGTNWTNAAGATTQSWNSRYAVFAGQAGDVVVEGPQTITGIQFLSDGYALSAGANGALQIAQTGTPFRVSNGAQATIGAPINGVGSLTKLDGGTLVLTGVNAYAGGTAVNGGTLSVSQDANLGAAGTGVALNGGSLQVTGTDLASLPRTVALGAAGGTLDVADAAHTLSLASANAVVGDGALTKVGAGTLALLQANGYAGGTRLNAGTLQVGNASSLGGGTLIVGGPSTLANLSALSLQNALTLNDALTVASAQDLRLAGNVDGAGSLIKTGAGALTLGGVNSYTGGTEIQSGTLVASAAALPGNVVNHGELIFDQAVDGTFSGNLTGRGTLIKRGAGELILAGTHAIEDVTVVAAGRLQVDGSLSTASLTIDPNATLGGSGSITGDVTVDPAGRLAAGTPSDNITINGDLNLGDSTQLDFGLGAPGSATSAVTVAGDLTLDGVLNVNDAGGFRIGVFRLFRFGGALTDNGLAYGSLPAGFDGENLTLQNQPGEVNLVVQSTADEVRFWNGGKTTADGTIAGGTGTWGTATNWTDATGTRTLEWDDRFAVFSTTGGAVTVNGNQAITGIQFLADGYTLTPGQGSALTIANAATPFRVDQGATATIDTPITGAGGLDKQDGGVLALNGVNTYAGGTTISGGALRVNSDAALGAADGNISLAGGVLSIGGTAFNSTDRAIALGNAGGGIEVVDAANTFTVDDNLTGSGAFTKQGAGTLVLTGTNSYTGGTSVAGGTLAGNTNSLKAAIGTQTGTTVRFVQAQDGQFAGTLSGAGGVRKDGLGTLQLTGNQPISGGVDLREGSLLLGDGTTGATLGSTVTIAAGAVLLGGGSVTGIDNAGTISAASAPGLNFTVSGNYVSQPGSALNVSLRDSNMAPITVTGTANLAGSLQAANGFVYNGGNAYPILRAGAVNGTFDSVNLPNLAFFTSSLAYSSDSVTLALQRNATSIPDAGETPNQGSTGEAISTMPAGSDLYEHIMGQSADTVAEALKQLSGDSHAGLSSALVRNSASARDIPLRHLQSCMRGDRYASGQAGVNRPYDAGNCDTAAWAEIIGNWQRQDGNNNVGSYRQHLGGVMVGGDVAVRNGWRVGGALGYTDGKIWQDDRNASAETQSWSVSVYGGRAIPMGDARALNVKAGAAYSWHELDTKRRVTVNQANQKLEADRRASTTQIFGEVGYEFPVSAKLSLEPFVGAAWIDQRMRGFAEKGGSAAVNGDSANQQVTTTTAGLRARGEWEVQGRPVGAFISGGWRHAFGDVDPKSRLQFQGSQEFTVAGTPVAKNAFVTEFGADVAITPNTRIGASYAGQFGKGSRDHAGMINIRWSF